MLKTYLNTVPYTKFVLIKDSVQHRDPHIIKHLVKQHLNKNFRISYYVFEGVFKRVQNRYQNCSNVILHDYVSDGQNWSDKTKDNVDFENKISKLMENEILVVDSLSHMILLYGLPHAYRILNELKNNKAVQQIITLIHKDLIEGDYSKICMYFDNLSTLSIEIKPKFMNDKGRIQYVYKKSGGKVINQVEEYIFTGEDLITSKIEKPDPKRIIETSTTCDVNPEELSTFRIGLTDEEKLSRDKVVLPYLPSENEPKPQEGKIFYQLDDLDDWDDEDPDDDLDI